MSVRLFRIIKLNLLISINFIPALLTFSSRGRWSFLSPLGAVAVREKGWEHHWEGHLLLIGQPGIAPA